MKFKKGDNVIVIAGKHKGTKSTIVRSFPKLDMVLLDGVNLVKRHKKPTQQSRKGQIVDKPMPIHASNVMILDPKKGKATRIKITKDKKGNRQRVATKSGEILN